jgi:hypothetical protein
MEEPESHLQFQHQFLEQVVFSFIPTLFGKDTVDEAGSQAQSTSWSEGFRKPSSSTALHCLFVHTINIYWMPVIF